MGSVRQPRGRLPRRVYWVRRAVVLAVALLLVFGIGKLLGGAGSDPSSANVEASTSSAHQQDSAASGSAAPVGPVAPSATPRLKGQVPVLPPSGECRDDEVSVQPSVPRAWGAGNVTIRLGLQGLQPACTFKVSPQTLVVKITSGNDRIWSSQDCPKAIPTSDVVVRSATPTYVDVVWSGRRSDENCSAGTAPWANAGFYHVFAAALGSAPTDVQFELTRAPTHVVRKTVQPKPKPKASASPSAKPSAKPTSKAPSSPSASPAGKGSKCGGDNAAGSC